MESNETGDDMERHYVLTAANDRGQVTVAAAPEREVLDSMANGFGVISAIVEECDCGETFRSCNVVSVAR